MLKENIKKAIESIQSDLVYLEKAKNSIEKIVSRCPICGRVDCLGH